MPNYDTMGARRRVLVLALVVMNAGLAVAETVPHQCVLAADGVTASIFVTNTLNNEASCLVNCKYSTAKYDDNPEMTCSKPVPAGKQVEMCVLHSSSGEKMLKLTTSRADCKKR